MVLKKGVELIIMDMLGCDEQKACDMWHGSKVGKLVDRYIEKKIQRNIQRNTVLKTEPTTGKNRIKGIAYETKAELYSRNRKLIQI